MTNPALETMTVAQLRELLAGRPDDAPVVFAYRTGDYWNTVAAGEIKGAKFKEVTYSAYSNGYRLVEEGDRDGVETVEVLVLS